MKKTIILASFFTLILSSCGNSAGLSCNQDELTKKMLLVNATMGEYVQKHPERATELQAKFQEVSKQAALANGPLNMCKMYDDFLNFMK
jgi:hypothetical protein